MTRVVMSASHKELELRGYPPSSLCRPKNLQDIIALILFTHFFSIRRLPGTNRFAVHDIVRLGPPLVAELVPVNTPFFSSRVAVEVVITPP